MKVITYEPIYTPLAKTNHSNCFFVLICVPVMTNGLLHYIIQGTQKDYIWAVYYFNLCLSPCKIYANGCTTLSSIPCYRWLLKLQVVDFSQSRLLEALAQKLYVICTAVEKLNTFCQGELLRANTVDYPMEVLSKKKKALHSTSQYGSWMGALSFISHLSHLIRSFLS